MTPTVVFVMEQTLGHRTHTQNLKKVFSGMPEVRGLWADIDFPVAGLGACIPFYRSNWTIRAGLRSHRRLLQLRAQMARQGGNFDALFFHTHVAAVLAFPWLARFPAVVSLDATPKQMDGLGAHYGHRQAHPWMERLKHLLHGQCFGLAKQLVVWSNWAKRGLVEDYRVPAEKISVIAPGVVVGDWTASQARESEESVRVLFVGGDFVRKGGPQLLRVGRELRAQGIPLELHLVTRARLEPEPGVRVYNDFEPNSESLRQLFFECHIFCLPTRADCLAMALAEAGAAALPLVTTDVGGHRDLVGDGETGFLLASQDDAALARALQELAANPSLRERLGEEARRRVVRDFDAKKNARRLLNLLETVAS